MVYDQHENYIQTNIQQERTQQWERASFFRKRSHLAESLQRSYHDTGATNEDPIAPHHAFLDPSHITLLASTRSFSSTGPLYPDHRDTRATEQERTLRMYNHKHANGLAPVGLERYLIDGSMTEGSVEARLRLRHHGIPEASMEHLEKRVEAARDRTHLSTRRGGVRSDPAAVRTSTKKNL